MSQDNKPKYFDLHLTGIGYVNKVREVTPEQGNPFWSVELTALHGAADNVQHTYFDCIVSGEEAKDVVRQLQSLVETGSKVLAGFKLSDLSTAPFIYTQGPRAGEPGVRLKSRLLRFDWIKVDGQPFLVPKKAAS